MEQTFGSQGGRPFISVLEGNGGSFELHEIKFGAFGHTQDAPGKEAIDLAVTQSEAGDHPTAVAGLSALLDGQPNHSVALALLGSVMCDLNDQPTAQRLFDRSLEIEPNSAKFRGQRVAVALRATYRRPAIELCEADLLQFLEAAYEAYPSDPTVQANLGAVLHRSGQYQRAAQLLLAAAGGISDDLSMCCAVNSAFALIKISAWEPAMQTFSDVMASVLSTAPHRDERYECAGTGGLVR